MKHVEKYIAATCIVIGVVAGKIAREANPVPKAPEEVTFSLDIYPITATICIACHTKKGENWSIYEDAYQHRADIYQKVVVDRTMPQGLFMSDKERKLFKDWIEQGAKK